MKPTEKVRVVLGLGGYERVTDIVDRLATMYELETVADSEEAYHTIHVFRPDVAVLDFSLSKIHPIELYEGLALAHAHVHFVICVTEDNYQVAQRVWKKRACDFIFKPFFPEQFINDLNKIVRMLLNERELVVLNKRVLDLEQELIRLKSRL